MFAFFLIILLYIFEKQARHVAYIFFNCFCFCLCSLSSSFFPRCTFIELKGCNQIQFFTLDFIYICDELVSFHSSLLCKFYTISKFKRINSKFLHHILLIPPCDISLNPGPVYSSQSSCSNE